jgi:hypothetical protein
MQRFYKFLSALMSAIGFEETSFKLYLMSLREEPRSSSEDERPKRVVDVTITDVPTNVRNDPAGDDRLRWN